MRKNGTNLKTTQITHRQDHTSVTTERWDTLGQELLILWQQAHGAPEGAVRVIAVQNGLMVFMENAFSQAELALTRQSADNLLQQYIDSLTRQMLPVLTARVEQVMERQVGTTSLTSNIEQNWMMVFIKFDKPICSEGNL